MDQKKIKEMYDILLSHNIQDEFISPNTVAKLSLENNIHLSSNEVVYISDHYKSTAHKSKKEKISFISGYINCMFWSSLREGDSNNKEENFDNCVKSDLSDEAIRKINRDCLKFIKQAGDKITSNMFQAGHDFWLTRCGHGCGFWSNDNLWGKQDSKDLTEMSKKFSEAHIFINDENKVDYFNG